MSTPQEETTTPRARPWLFWLKMAAIGSALLLVSFLYVGFTYGWPDWTGFTEERPPVGIQIIGLYQSEKTLWDWMQLLFVPVVLGIGAAVLNRTERINAEKAAEKRAETEQKIADKRAQDEILEAYLDRMLELLVDKGLLKSDPDDEVRDVARIRTLTSLRRLDVEHRQLLMQFLLDADLITLLNNLRGANLSKLNLFGVDLMGINLADANLKETNLKVTNLKGADLTRADLRGADLTRANLEEANLFVADLRRADLRWTNLTNATMPNGGKYQEGADPKTYFLPLSRDNE